MKHISKLDMKAIWMFFRLRDASRNNISIKRFEIHRNERLQRAHLVLNWRCHCIHCAYEKFGDHFANTVHFCVHVYYTLLSFSAKSKQKKQIILFYYFSN